MSGTCCFISFDREIDLALRESERLDFILSGTLYYLTFAKRVHEYLFPHYGALPARANQCLMRMRAYAPEIGSILLIPEREALSLPFSFYSRYSFDRTETLPPLTSEQALRQIIDRSDICLFYFNEADVSPVQIGLFHYAENGGKKAVNLYGDFKAIFDIIK